MDAKITDSVKHIKKIQNMLLISQKCDALLQLIGPTRQNYQLRRQVFTLVVETIQRVIPSAVVVPYGSFTSKCYLFNSDIDFCCWTPEQDIKQSSRTVQSALNELGNASQIQLIDADVPVVKCVINEIGVDVSFSQPSGLLAACFIEYIDTIIQKDHLFKRTLVLTQNYFLNELHVLGSHNFMISSYAIRTMVTFILLNQTNIVSPIQALLALLAFFRNFDFENNVITIFGVCNKSFFEQQKTAFQVVEDLQQKYLQNSNNQYLATQLIRNVNHLMSCRMTCDEKPMREKGFLNILHTRNTEPTNQLREVLAKIMEDKKLAEEQRRQRAREYVEAFIRQLRPENISDEQHLFTKSVNICDPLMPSNNLGRSVSRQSMLRMQRCIQQGYQQLYNLTQLAMGQNEECGVEVCAEFDLIFLNTIGMTGPEKQPLDFEVNLRQLQTGMYKIVGHSFGIQANGIVCDPGDEETDDAPERPGQQLE